MPDISQSIDTLCARYLHDDGPGFALAVMRDGEVLYRKTFGLANLEHGVPITPETVFETASVSKQFTAFAVHLLARDGTLSLDDDIRRHLPRLPDFGRPITLRHCLHHTCGLREWGDSMGLGGRLCEDSWEPEFVFRWLERQRGLNHAPGAEFLYSNTGYFVLAAVVAAASDMSFAEVCRARIFAPLGMTNTHFREALRPVIKNRAESYDRLDDGTFALSPNNQALPGATSLQTTIDDMLLWLRHFETGHVGGPEVIAAMHRPGTLSTGQALPYGSGLELVQHRGADVAFHTGGWASFASLTALVPAKRLAIAVLSNTSEINCHRIWPPLVDLLLDHPDEGSVSDAVPIPLSASNADLTGLYLGPGGPLIEISEQDGTLRTGAIAGDPVALTPLGGLRLSPVGAAHIVLEFARDKTGHISHYTVAEHGIPGPARIRIAPETGDVVLSDYVGTFYSDELEVSYALKLNDETLTLSSISFGDEPLTPVTRDIFIDANRGLFPDVFTFERDAGGSVTAVLMGNSDARNQRFARMRPSADHKVRKT